MNNQKRDQKAVDEFVRRALERYEDKIEDIVLFGSVARGEAGEESDIDILIVTKKEDFRLRRALIGIAFDILLETGENISVKAYQKMNLKGIKIFHF